MNLLLAILYILTGFNPWRSAKTPPPYIMDTRWGHVTENVLMSNGDQTMIGFYQEDVGWIVAETEEPVTEGQRSDVIKWKLLPE